MSTWEKAEDVEPQEPRWGRAELLICVVVGLSIVVAREILVGKVSG